MSVRQRRSILRFTVPLDASFSFVLPVAVLVLVPILAVVDAPPGAVGVAAILSAVILGGCGVVMAAGLAGTMLRGEAEHPEIARYLAKSARGSAAGGSGSTVRELVYAAPGPVSHDSAPGGSALTGSAPSAQVRTAR